MDVWIAPVLAWLALPKVGLPSLFDPSVEEILVSTGVRLAESLFPEAEPWDAGRGWTAQGNLPGLETAPLAHPSASLSEARS